jgi:hypothetical protein
MYFHFIEETTFDCSLFYFEWNNYLSAVLQLNTTLCNLVTSYVINIKFHGSGQ